MSDRRKNNGGYRPGAGRKPRIMEMELQGLLVEAWPIEKRRAALERLATIAEKSESITAINATKLLLAYAYGNPIDRQEHSGGIEIVKGYATDASPDDWDNPD